MQSRSTCWCLLGLVALLVAASGSASTMSGGSTIERDEAALRGTNVLACWDFSDLTPPDALPAGERVEDSCGDHDAYVLESLDVNDGVRPDDGALAFSSGNPDALLFEPGHDFGDGGPVAGSEFDFQTGDGITLEALIRVPPSFSGFGSIVSKDVGAGHPSWWFRISDGVLQGFVGDGNIQQVLTGEAEINDGRWHHVALVRQAGDSLNLYVDYQLDATVELPDQDDITTPSGTAINIGAFNNGARELEGDIQMVRIARAALSPQDFLLHDEVANVSVSIESDGQPPIPDSTIEYLITVDNAGPADTSGVAVEALMPPEVAAASWSCAASGSASCTASGSGDVDDLIDLPANQSVTYSLSAEIGPDPTDVLTYTASIEPAAEIDLTPDNNTASATNELNRLYVDHSAGSGGDGLTWASAFRHLQDALAAAQSLAEEGPVEIWVTAGVYYPDEGSGASPNARTNSFELIDNVEVYGGFAGTESELEERDWLANTTVLSGDVDGNDIVSADGVTERWQDIVGNNSYQVVRGKFLTSAVLDGFTITGGRANGGGIVDTYFVMRYGGGLQFHDSAVTLNRLHIRGNLAQHDTYPAYGGGLHTDSSSGSIVRLNEVTIENNLGGYGGGMGVTRTRILGDRVRFRGNEAETRGGAMDIYEARYEFRNSVFSGNSSTKGGAIYSLSLHAALASSLVTGNHASDQGGGVYFFDPDGVGGALVLTNTTLSGNSAGTEGGAVYRTRNQQEGGYTEARNTIIWNNQDSTGIGTASSTHAGNVGDRITASHSLLHGIDPGGESNFDGTDPANAPGFPSPLDPSDAPSTAGDFHLPATSQLIDSGDNQARINANPNGWQNPIPALPIAGNIEFDLDGVPRIVDGDDDGPADIDLGPYESLGELGYSIGGQVSGLVGVGLELQNNDGDPLALTSNGNFSFPGIVADDTSYDVTVLTQPGSPIQTCSVSNGSGTVNGQDVSDILVDCVTNSYTVGGQVVGLAGDGLVLGLVGNDDLAIDDNGDFEFPTALPDGSAFEIVVVSQPAGPLQTCSVIDGTGTIDGADIDAVEVECVTDLFTVGGTVSGLSGPGLILRNNDGDDLAIPVAGSFEFGTSMPSDTPYDVTIWRQPDDPLQTCTVNNGAGTIIDADIGDVLVDCVDRGDIIFDDRFEN